MRQMTGKQSISFAKAVYIEGSAAIVGEKEKDGPLGEYFSHTLSDPMCGQESWEEGESELQLATAKLAMQKANVYINGTKVMTHEGGYIPFVIDISDKVNYGTENTIAVKIDSRANTSFAPGKAQPDFQYFGGIYGNSYITVTDELHITDAV